MKGDCSWVNWNSVSFYSVYQFHMEKNKVLNTLNFLLLINKTYIYDIMLRKRSYITSSLYSDSLSLTKFFPLWTLINRSYWWMGNDKFIWCTRKLTLLIKKEVQMNFQCFFHCFIFRHQLLNCLEMSSLDLNFAENELEFRIFKDDSASQFLLSFILDSLVVNLLITLKLFEVYR